MRAFLVPVGREPEVLESPTWSEEDIARTLGVETEPHPRYWSSSTIHKGPNGRPFALIRPALVAHRWPSMARDRPVLVFPLSDIGMISSLTRREVLYLSLMFALEDSLLALPASPKEIG